MSLPRDFKSAIQENYGDFGWELANCLCFIAEYKGYKVREFSSIESCLELINKEEEEKIVDYESPVDLEEYLTKKYLLVHETLIEIAKNIKDSESLKEGRRKDKVVDDFINYMIDLNLEINLIAIDKFFRDYVIVVLKVDLIQWLLKIETTPIH